MLRIFALLILLSAVAFAGGRGGHNTTFDPNRFGGPSNVACITAAVSSICTTGFNASCDGTGTGDEAARVAWLAYGVARGAAQSILYYPPGSNCVFDGCSLNVGIQNAVNWAYGAITNGCRAAGDRAFFNDNTHGALLQTASVGASSVTFVTASDLPSLAVGDRVIITSNALQNGGYPLNVQNFEYNTVASVSAGPPKVIGLSPLVNTYLSTLPAVGWGDGGQTAGPATLYVLDPVWNTNVTIYGMQLRNVGGQFGALGRTVALYDMVFDVAGLNPTASDNLWIFWSNVVQVEIDKEVNTLNFFRSNADQISGQSASTNNLNLTSVTIRAGAVTLNGTPKNANIINSYLPVAKVGPIGFGAGNSVSLDGTFVGSALSAFEELVAADLTFVSGTFHQAKASPTISDFYRVLVPGHKYYYGTHNGGVCSPLTTFTVTALTEDATNVYAATDSPTTQPTPTCGGAMTYNSYPAMTIVQKNSQAGSADLTQFAAPP